MTKTDSRSDFFFYLFLEFCTTKEKIFKQHAVHIHMHLHTYMYIFCIHTNIHYHECEWVPTLNFKNKLQKIRESHEKTLQRKVVNRFPPLT